MPEGLASALAIGLGALGPGLGIGLIGMKAMDSVPKISKLKTKSGTRKAA